MIDLHTHSNFSDGALSPEDLVQHAQENGVTTLALADHDCTDGLARFQQACLEHNIQGIGAIELSTELHERGIHILGFGVRHDSEKLQQFLEKKRSHNTSRVVQIMKILKERGVAIDSDAVLSTSGNNLKRVHVVKYLLTQEPLLAKIHQILGKEIQSINELFRYVVGKHGIAYVPGLVTTPSEGCSLIHEAGGIAVVAHPGLGNRMPEESFFSPLQADGLDGIECFYPEHSAEQTAYFLTVAKNLQLLVSGGTDFHGGGVHAGVEIGKGFGDFVVPEEDVTPLFQRLGLSS